MPTTPTHPPTQRSEHTREALLRAGTLLFVEHGFEGASVEQIAREAGVNKALINYHFGGKRGLYVAILDTTFGEIREGLRALAQSGGTPEQLLGRMLDLFRVMAEERRPGFPALMLREAMAPGERFGRLIGPHLAAMVNVVRLIVERGIREKRFRKVDPLLTHLAMIGGMAFFFATQKGREHLAVQGAFPGRFPTGEEFVEYMKGLMLNGLAVERAPRRPRSERSRAK
jgi:TetR/AcrR family transcriptional regulator